MEYTLYPLQDQARFSELCALFAMGLDVTTPTYWKWKHYSENGMPEGIILVAEDENGQLAGMFALQPEYFICGEQRRLLVQTEDLVIHPNHRGTGLMKKLYLFAEEYFAAKGADGFIAFTNDTNPVFVYIRHIQTYKLAATDAAIQKQHQNGIIPFFVDTGYGTEQSGALIHCQILRQAFP